MPLERPISISARELHHRIAGGESAVIIDVREPDEYWLVHIKDAISLPLDHLDSAALEECLQARQCPPGTQLYLVCRTGHRSYAAWKRIVASFPRAVIVADGTLAWAQGKLPVRIADADTPAPPSRRQEAVGLGQS